jgi:hypothetical protein
MPPNPRLPIVDSDDGIWGNILDQFLAVQHVNTGGTNGSPGNGGHQNVTIIASTGTAAPLTFNSGTLLSTPATGSLEFNTDTLFFTITTSATRKTIAMYDDSSGAAGDTYYRTSTGSFVRLPIGTSAGKVLSVSSSGLPVWSNNLAYATSTQTTGYNIQATDATIFANATTGNVTITLPLASSVPGYQFNVKRIDSSTTYSASVACSGSDTIDGQSSISFPQQYMSLTVISNGSAWYIL